ncbi:MAG: peroxiredoxin [Devosiaceae bacterium]|nr:peroxiredoxin [Devosiaceae bacterium]
MIKSGEKIPGVSIWCIKENFSGEINSSDLFAGGTSILFTLPGAYTPTCHNYHLPGYLKNAHTFRELGIKNIVCASVNDKYVMDEWAKNTGAIGEIDFLADFDGRFASALGLNKDLSAAGLGNRFARSAMIIEQGIVTNIYVDDARGQTTNTGALHLLDVLGSSRVKETCVV